MKGAHFHPLALLIGAAAALLIGAAAPVPETQGFAGAAEVKAQVAAMRREMKPDQGFLWRPLVRAGETIAAVEIWRKPGKPAVHPAEGEYATVLAGAGTLVSGGTLADQVARNPGLTEGSRIEGGTTRSLKPGDVFLIPAGAPHWFGITGGELVLLGIKVPKPAH